MSGMMLTPVSPTPEKSIERQGSTSESERPSERFDDVSAREKARLERKEARQDRADQRAEDNRVASRQAEQDRLEENRAKQSEQADKAEESRETANAGDRHSEEGTSQKGTADKGASDDNASDKAEAAVKQVAEKTGQAAGQEGVKGDEVLPMLFSVPAQQDAGSQAMKGLTIGASTQGTGLPPTSGTALDKLMMQSQQQGTGAGSGDSLLGSKGEPLGLLAGKAALAADGKTVDFSAQLARFQGSGDTSSLQNNATALQRGLEGRESMATLKSYSTSVDLPVQHAQWGEKVAGKLAWLTSQRMSAAEIHVTPPDLGPLEVRVQVQHDQAHVTVHATHSAVRDQLELNGHRLRDMLQENGLNLDKFEVSAESSDQGAQQQLAEEGGSGGGGYGRGADAELEVLDEPLAGGSLDLSWRGEVDLYA